MDFTSLSPSLSFFLSFSLLPVFLSLVHTDGFYRGDKLINLKVLADDALQKCREK